MIMSGELTPGEALPSMRNLAMQMRISLITTKRAYEELERDGFIETYTGKGSEDLLKYIVDRCREIAEKTTGV